MLSTETDADAPTYRRLSGSGISPTFRRTKSVRASLRMLGARWKPAAHKNDVLIRKDSHIKDIVMERFGKELNDTLKNRMQNHINNNNNTRTDNKMNESSLKSSTAKWFYSFGSKENVPAKSQSKFYNDIPANVAPKAAALLQIPIANAKRDQIVNNNKQSTQNCQRNSNNNNNNSYSNCETSGKRKDADKSIRIDRQTGDLITNAQQFDDLRMSATTAGNVMGNNGRLATVRRAPYWTNNVLYSKNNVVYMVLVVKVVVDE